MTLLSLLDRSGRFSSDKLLRGSEIRNTSKVSSNDRFSSDSCRRGPKFGMPLKLIIMIVLPRISVEGVRNSECLSSQ